MYPYQPSQGFQPLMQPYQPLCQPPQTVTRLAGLSSARQLRLPPNSSMLALDYDDRHVYAVASDGAGVVDARMYSLVPCDEQQGGEYVTRKQFDEFREAVNGRISELQPHSAGLGGDAAADRRDQPE